MNYVDDDECGCVVDIPCVILLSHIPSSLGTNYYHRMVNTKYVVDSLKVWVRRGVP